MGISFRAILIGIVAVVLVCVIVSYAELLVVYIQIGFLQLPPVVVAMLAFLLLGSAGARRIREKFGLNPQELMTIYCMMLLSAMVSSRGLVEKLIPLLVSPNYFANDSNNWSKLFGPHIKKWMVPYDPSNPKTQWIAQRFFERLREGERLPWAEWMLPLAMWSALALLIFGAFLCLAAILRRQWSDNERLSFPLAQLPIEMVMTEKATTFFRNPLTWMAFSIPMLLFFMNGLHNWLPNVPLIPVMRSLNSYLVNPPWNHLTYMPMYLSFAVIGFMYLLPSEVLLSLWLFFVLAGLESVFLASRGVEMEMMPLYGCSVAVGYQCIGAYLVLVVSMFWMARPHLKKALRTALGTEKADDTQELLPYRTALIGLLVCIIGSAIWLRLAGMSLWLAFFELIIYIFVIALVMARGTAEAGLLMTETSFRPTDILRLFVPIGALGQANMTVLAFTDSAFLRDQRGLILTGFLDGMKITDRVGMSRKRLALLFVCAILLAMIVAGALQLWMPYHYGGLSLYAYTYQDNNHRGFRYYTPIMAGNESKLSWQAPVFLVLGILATVFIATMRANAAAWPFHPLGLAMAGSWTMMVFWFPCLVAWALKSTFIRYGGMRFYAKTRPFFLGLILGEFTAAVLWTAISAATGLPAPDFPWP